jgi:hypothetical protein
MTLEEFVKSTLCKNGIQEATGVQLTFKDGRTLTIHSDDHPALAQSVNDDDEPTVLAVNSAQGGF